MKKRILWPIIIGLVMALSAFFFLTRFIDILYQPGAYFTVSGNSNSSQTSESTTEETHEEYECPIDFDELQSYNPDVYAWIHIEGTNIDYAVVQSEDDDTFYMDHNSDAKRSSAGALFTEHEYNAKDFGDPVTVIYGHDLTSGAMFGHLQRDFTSNGFLEDNPVIEIYLPDKLIKYQVFAAVPYKPDHIIHNQDFSNRSSYNSFFDDVYSIDDAESRVNSDFSPVYGDKVLILSTCLSGDRDSRYLVMGKMIYDSSVDG